MTANLRLYTLANKHADPYSFAKEAMGLIRSGELVLRTRGAASVRELIAMYARVKQRPNPNQAVVEEFRERVTGNVGSEEVFANPTPREIVDILAPLKKYKMALIPRAFVDANNVLMWTGNTVIHNDVSREMNIPKSMFQGYLEFNQTGQKIVRVSLSSRDARSKNTEAARTALTIIGKNRWVAQRLSPNVSFLGGGQTLLSGPDLRPVGNGPKITQKEEFVDIITSGQYSSRKMSDELFKDPTSRELSDLKKVSRSYKGEIMLHGLAVGKTMYVWNEVEHEDMRYQIGLLGTTIPVYLVFDAGMKLKRVEMSISAVTQMDEKNRLRRILSIPWVQRMASDTTIFYDPWGPRKYKYTKKELQKEEFVDIATDYQDDEGDDEVYKDPTPKEWQTILKQSWKTSAAGNIRAYAYSNSVYVWAGNVQHGDVWRSLHLPPQGIELYFVMEKGKSKMEELLFSITTSRKVPKHKAISRRRYKEVMAIHPWISRYVTPETWVNFSDEDRDTKTQVKDLV